MTSGPYARIYHHVMDDAKFDGIREDARLFGSWALCLLVADMAYPSPAYVPPTISRASYARLCEVGLLDALDGQRFKVHGLQGERERRSSAARVGGLASGRSRAVERPLNEGSRSPRTDLNLAEQSRAEQSRSLTREGLTHITAEVANCATDATGLGILSFGDKAQTELDRLCERHGGPAVVVAMATVLQAIPRPSPNQLVYGVVKVLEPFLDPKAAQKVASEEAAAESSRRGVEATLRQNHRTGFHGTPDPRCPLCQGAAA